MFSSRSCADVLNAEASTLSMTGYNAYDASWAPDGEHFALVSRGASRVFVFNSDGSDHLQRRIEAFELPVGQEDQ